MEELGCWIEMKNKIYSPIWGGWIICFRSGPLCLNIKMDSNSLCQQKQYASDFQKPFAQVVKYPVEPLLLGPEWWGAL